MEQYATKPHAKISVPTGPSSDGGVTASEALRSTTLLQNFGANGTMIFSGTGVRGCWHQSLPILKRAYVRFKMRKRPQIGIG